MHMALYILGVLLWALTFIPDFTDGQVFDQAIGGLILTGLAAAITLVGLRVSPTSRKPPGRVLLGIIIVAMVVRASLLPGLRRQQDHHNAHSKAHRLLQVISRTDVETVRRLASDGESVQSWMALQSVDRLAAPTPRDYACALLVRGWEAEEEKRRGK